MELTSAGAWRPDWARRLFPAWTFEHARGAHYLDSAATSQRMALSVQAQFDYETSPVGNAHRGAHPLAQSSSEALERARAVVAAYVGVSPSALAFTSGATESANLLAQAARRSMGPSDAIFVSQMEHHSNYLPWLAMAQATGCDFVEMPVLPNGALDMDWLASQLPLMRPRWVCVTAMSNVTGEAPDIERIVRWAKEANPLARVVIDAAQAVAHGAPKLPLWGGDFAFFSSHKVFSPAGSGVLAAQDSSLFDELDPGKYGGGMIRGFRLDGSARWASGRSRFEAGSSNVGAAVALAAAIGEVSGWDAAALAKHESELGHSTVRMLGEIGGVHVLGEASHGLVSFHAEWAHAHDIGSALDNELVFARVGHHCALPLMRAFGVPACVRFSFGPGSDHADAQAAVAAVEHAKRRFS